jgi:hypothetical protein
MRSDTPSLHRSDPCARQARIVKIQLPRKLGLGLRALSDTLPGRTETVELWPFSQGEIDGVQDGFIDAAFAMPGR